MIGIYLGTQTLENAERSDELILQILADSQYRLVNQLGKQSGSKIDKIARLQKRKLLTTWKDFPVLKDAIALLQLRKLARWDAGDHVCFLFDVLDYCNQTDAKPLDLFILKKNGIIRS